SGIDSDKSLDMVKEMVDNRQAQEKIEGCQELMKKGDSLETALVKSGLFSGLYARMVTIGFKTGNADEVMHNIAQNLSDEVDVEINRKISLIEPSLVAVFSVIVGMILLSVMLPLMGIMSSIG
ncbi:MAG: type II secretion system F family protein, partial [Oscillospiraceae bacterium]